MDFTSNFFFILAFLFYLLLYVLKRIHWVDKSHIDSYVLVASIGIYTLWYPPAVLILAYVIGVTQVSARLLAKQPRQGVLTLAVMALLAPLLFFKYFDFVMALIMAKTHDQQTWLLPLGISFYVFTAIGYLVTVYRDQLSALLSFKKVALLISFWPHLAAGPILRAELFKNPKHHMAKLTHGALMAGLVLIVGGAAKKIFIADNLGAYVNHNIDQGLASMDALSAVLTVFGFGGQIYADFSGYSEMALGFALLIGYRIPANFNYPYLAASATEFWHRWHISLSTWFRDFLYFPLGGSRQGFSRTCINLMLVFVISGLWHGASISFLIWGAAHGVLLIVNRIYQRHFEPMRFWLGWILTFVAVNWVWVFFRFEVDEAWLLTSKLFDPSAWSAWRMDSAYYSVPIVFFLLMTAVDHWFKYYHVNRQGGLEVFGRRSKAMTYLYVTLMLGLAATFSGQPIPFIYFEF